MWSTWVTPDISTTEFVPKLTAFWTSKWNVSSLSLTSTVAQGAMHSPCDASDPSPGRALFALQLEHGNRALETENGVLFDVNGIHRNSFSFFDFLTRKMRTYDISVNIADLHR